jgi:uncharacterized membrane protein YbhN (UPF0104 family)
MNNINKKEINLLNLQSIATSIYIISLLISIYITNVDKDRTINPNKKHKNTINISIFNRVLVLILTFTFLYINYENRKLAIKKGEKPDLFNLQILSSELIVLSSIIVLYVVIKSAGKNYTITAGVGNPNL